MSPVYDGGQAFPALSRSEVYDHRDGDKYVTHETVGGMSLRAYFMAHAPAEPQPWFRPVLAGPGTTLPSSVTNPTDAERHELDGWRDGEYSAQYLKQQRAREYAMAMEECRKASAGYSQELERQRYLQWPAAWADEQLAILRGQP